MIPRPSLIAVVALATACLAGAAQAEARKATPIFLPYRAEAPKTADAWVAKTPRATSYAQSNALRAAGLARTSLDRRFADDDVVGSFGFLCGIQPSGGGPAPAHGEDPHGRFLGAKLSRAF